MKVIHLLALSLLMVADYLEVTRAEDGMELVAMKRPFCNAFTGCGRKRDPSYAGYNGNAALQMPMPLYRVLLRLANDAGPEARMMRQQQQQQRLAHTGSFEPLLPNQLQLPRANLF